MQSPKNQLDVQKYLDVFHKYKWHGLIPACIVMLILFAGSVFLPKIYESSCLIEIDRGTIENPFRSDRERVPSLGEHLSAFSQNALRWDVLSRIIDAVGPEAILQNGDVYNLGKLKKTLGLGDGATNDDQESQPKREAVVGYLKKEVQFRQRPPQFLVISYRGTRSDVNSKILNTLVSVLIEEKIKAEVNMAGRNYEFIKSEMETYRQELEQAETHLKEFKEKHISELPNNINVHLAQLTNDRSELLACELEMKELTTRVRYIDEEMKKQSELIVSEIRREANPMITVLNQRIVDMEVELTRLRTNYTELHPRVIELKGQIEDLKKQRDGVDESTLDTQTSMLNPVHQQLAQDKQNALVRLEVLKSRMANLQKRIVENEKKVENVPAQEQQLLTLTRNYEVNAQIYNMFLQKLEEVRIQEKLATEQKGKESFKVLEYARATTTPVAPDRVRVMGFIALAGIATCIGVILLLNYFDDSFKSVEEAKEFLQKPLMGTVPSLDMAERNGHSAVHNKLLKAIGKSRGRP
ncbi:MAG: hypothetical protein C4532_06265 [Candidatus Abyssobacteria bacterium SURF_17]|uniref:Tyrosine-protein kinase G-rich domain-containing protein n=1 Tax=Candidatus Abyssobacteria bacterium SURF_17 TaxID=2093361 RepID=A0A419F2H7_9BACT|nr:MAG: hypothetical protein C4532_06265 [Candidatus Abyssubacteria bacterium SURF_17]